jgi:hypothetical protein
MDKSLHDKNKTEQSENGQDEVRPRQPAAVPDFKKQIVGAYNPELTAQAWDKDNESNKALKDTVKGRGMIRLFSRGVMGASAFAIGGWYANKQMRTYGIDKPVENWVQAIARAFDHGAGTPIKAAVNILGRDGEKFVNNFRPTVKYEGYAKAGRSLGHEVVMVTFDFATMSIGDFWGRKIAHTLDPNREKPVWKNEDGSIDWSKALKTFSKNWWSALSYSQGEDWAVAVPYCLAMRHMGTPALNKVFPGYKFEFDRNGNGGGMLVNAAGRVTGNFTTAGLLNLWERFTTYNVGTLMFREAYHWAGSRMGHALETHEMPALVEKNPANPNRSTVDTITDGAKQFGNWVVRSTAKAVTYMIPAVPFFWITRTPQHKFQGAFIHPEKGVLMYHDAKGAKQLLRANTLEADKITNVFFSATGEHSINPFSYGEVKPNAKTWGLVDTLMNPIAKVNDKIRTQLRGPIGKLHAKIPGVNKATGISNAETYINAAIAYTPYFWAKSDWLADKWDTGRTDAAFDRAIAGAMKLNAGEFRAGMHEVGRALKEKAFDDPVREQYAQCREATDSTPSDNKFDINPVQGGNCDKILHEADHISFAGRVKKKDVSPAATEKAQPKIAPSSPLNFRERMIHGGKKTEVVSPRGVSHAEAQEMRKALEDFNPPTNSIN